MNALVIIGSLLALSSLLYGAAQLDSEKPRLAIKEAFADGTLTYDIYRLLEAVPGFIVTESDNAGSCYMYGHMLAPSESFFGLGARSAVTEIANCEALDVVVQEADSPAIYISYYRYWQGAAAVSKAALSVLSVDAYQWLLTLLLVALAALMSLIAWRRSAVLGLGFVVTFSMTTDFLWQGFSPLHAVATLVGLTGALIVYASFARSWSTRWGWVVVAGISYAMFAHTLVPMALLLLTYMVAFLAQDRTNREIGSLRGFFEVVAIAVLWIAGYVGASLARWVWVITLGPGLDTLRGEFGYSSDKFTTTAIADPFLQLVGLLSKTWLEFGVMQVGLVAMGLLLGISIGKLSWNRSLIRPMLVLMSPLVFPLAWFAVWAFHINHTYVHAVPSVMVLTVLFAVEKVRLSQNTESDAAHA
jgi:hypothetical protein